MKAPTLRQMNAARACVRAEERVKRAEQARDAAYERARSVGMYHDPNQPSWSSFEVEDGGMYVVEGES